MNTLSPRMTVSSFLPQAIVQTLSYPCLLSSIEEAETQVRVTETIEHSANGVKHTITQQTRTTFLVGMLIFRLIRRILYLIIQIFICRIRRTS